MKFVPRYKPYDHQLNALAAARNPDGSYKAGFGYFMEMGCVDRDTEYLSPTGWRKMRDYDGGMVAQFHLNGDATFVQPDAYVVKPCDEFYHFKTERGVDQMLSADHRILICAGSKSTVRKNLKLVGEVPRHRYVDKPHFAFWREVTPKNLVHTVHIPTSFHLQNHTKLDLSDEQIRVQIAFHADGSYGKKDLAGITRRRKGAIGVKKERKKIESIILRDHYEQPLKG